MNNSRPEAEKEEVIYFDVGMTTVLDLVPVVTGFSPLPIFRKTILGCYPVYQLLDFVPPVDSDR